jgi:phytoene desaturase
MSKKICVIGGGLGGLSAAIRLANKGFEVDLYEQNEFVGGKAGEINYNGFRFDTGPSLLTMPEVLVNLFNECNENINEFLEFEKLDIICKYFYSDNTEIRAYSDLDRFGEEVNKITEDNYESLKNYLKYCNNIYDYAGDLFLTKDISGPKTFFNLKSLRTLFNLHKIDPFRTMNEANKSFFKDKKLIQLFNRYATYNGSSPYLAPATLNIIPHVEYNMGSFLPKKGIYSIVNALRKLAEKKSVKFFNQHKVNEILTQNNKATGINVNNQNKNYDAVISNVDVNTTFKNLIRDTSNREAIKYSKHTPSFSGLVFYWGVSKVFPQLETHNIFFAKDYNKEFANLFENKIIHNDPTVYIYVSSKLNKEDAPAGKENWFVMINAPYNENQNWESEIRIARNSIIKKINNRLNVDIEKSIEFEKVLSPVDIQNKTGSYLGSIYGIASNARTTAFRRQPNKSKSIKNLYFCGGSAHPGGGIPLVILSGKIVSDIITKEFRL